MESTKRARVQFAARYCTTLLVSPCMALFALGCAANDSSDGAREVNGEQLQASSGRPADWFAQRTAYQRQLWHHGWEPHRGFHPAHHHAACSEQGTPPPPPQVRGLGGIDECLLTSESGLSAACSRLSGAFSDLGGAGTSLASQAQHAGMFCTKGHVERSLDDGEQSPGAGGILVDLLGKGSDAPVAYDALSDGVVGFGFRVQGVPQDGWIRFGMKLLGESEAAYCSWLPLQEGYNQVLLADVRERCWEHGHAIDPTRIESFSFQVMASRTKAYEYDFCVGDVTALK